MKVNSLPNPSHQPSPTNRGPVAPKTYPGRPVADYEATDSVQIHALASELAPDFMSTIYQKMGSKVQKSSAGFQGPRSGYSDQNLVWLRDFSPLFVQTEENIEARKFLSENPVRQNYTGGTSVPVAPPTQEHEFLGPRGKEAFIRVEVTPLLVDGGDLVPVGETLIVGERVFQRNSVERTEPHLVEAGYQKREREAVTELLHKSTGADQIVSIPWWPGDKTGHADMPVQSLSDGEVMVPDIPKRALDVLGYHHEKEHGQKVQTYLNSVANTLEEAGLEVHRLPMMAPVELTEGPHGWDAKSYTPANAYRGDTFICLPSFQDEAYPVEYQKTKSSFEDQWKHFYEERGLEVEILDATELGRANGLFHCLTSGVPSLREDVKL